MAMRSNSSPRRVYTRKGTPLVCFSGVYFGPKADSETAINTAREVRIEVVAQAGGRKRIEVRQAAGKHSVTETWVEKHLEFGTRTASVGA